MAEPGARITVGDVTMRSGSKDSLFRAPLERALNHAVAYLDEVKDGRAAASLTREELRARIERPLPDRGSDPVAIIDEMVADASGGLHGVAGGRFFGWVMGSSMPSAIAADWLATAWDQNAALFACSPSAAIYEEVVGRWLKELLDLPRASSFALVTGCQAAHLTCLAAARHHLLQKREWDVEARGLAGAPRIRMITSTERHGSVTRALKLLGLGTECVMALPSDATARLRPGDLERALQEHMGEPVIVLLQAGDVNTGAFDSFTEIVSLAHRHDAWVHVDGAFGLWVKASPALSHLAEGVEGADSWSTDGHKWLNLPFDSGFAFVAHPASHQAALSHRASYLDYDADARDAMDWNPEWSRRARAFAAYAAMRELGREGIADLIDRTCRHAASIVDGIGALDGAQVIHRPVINQGLVRFSGRTPGAGEEDHDRMTDAVIESILRGGDAHFTGTTWRGRRCMRVSVCSWRTDTADVARAIDGVGRALEELRGRQPVS